ncbi:MAG TPA: NUDIX hydrolase [Acidimicrobiia bacterium]|nr:NUDIX hydrolase [Acidimicrobiia bacterium]
MTDDDAAGVPAVPAATVVLLRDAPGGIETLMLRRDADLAFAGGAWVFPGGRIDADDFPGGIRSDEPETLLVAARNAAARESMEEAGLRVDPDSLVWFAHWTPPAIGHNQRRFATWFFATRAPVGAVVVDDGEIRDHVWIRPADALRRRDDGEILIIPPTWMTLHTLADAASIDELLSELAAGDPAVYVTRIGRAGGVGVSMWAGDAGYEDGDAERPGHRHRLVMDDKGWRLERDV